MITRLVLDSSVVLAAADPAEVSHRDAADFFERVRAAHAAGDVTLFGPPELWLETELTLRRKGLAARPFADLSVRLVPLENAVDVLSFLDEIEKRTRGKHVTANATDFAYLWVAWRERAVLVTLDQALLKVHGAVCDVMRPFHVR